MSIRIILTCLFLIACAPISHNTIPADEAPELDPTEPAQPIVDESTPDQPEVDAPASDDPLIFTLPHQRCLGHWADNSDSSTRFTAHPDTGLCTFACVWEDPRCEESWFGDPRCFPAHAAVLGELCSELGGTCALDAARSNRYCVAP